MKEIIQFREVESKDFKTIHKWFNEKHVREFFQPEEINLEQVISKYQPRLDENHPVNMHMALLEINSHWADLFVVSKIYFLENLL